LENEALLPFSAMYEIDREQFCLTEIDSDSQVNILWNHWIGNQTSVVVLEIYNHRVSRSVFFLEEGEQYVWVGEHQWHYSGETLDTPDGEIRAHIIVSYINERIASDAQGVPAGLRIDHFGVPGLPLMNPTCEQVWPLIREWETTEAIQSND
jgi:hypothetical protein